MISVIRSIRTVSSTISAPQNRLWCSTGIDSFVMTTSQPSGAAQAIMASGWFTTLARGKGLNSRVVTAISDFSVVSNNEIMERLLAATTSHRLRSRRSLSRCHLS